MSNVCIIGGTRFFGKMLGQTLIDQGHSVTIVTRGHSSDDFGNAVQRIHADATQAQGLTNAIGMREFDIVFHQMCYSPIAALAAGQAFANKIGRLVMTSTIEVYNQSSFAPQPTPTISPFAQEHQVEPQNLPYDSTLPWLDPVFAESHYAEGKRQAESAFTQLNAFPVAFARVGHVLAVHDEFTGRFRFHAERILNEQPIITWPNAGKTSFIHAPDIAAFLAWLGQTTLTGAINACSPQALTVHDLCTTIEQASGKRAIIEEQAHPEGDPALSPFAFPHDFAMATTRAEQAGYQFAAVESWLPEIATATIAAIKG